MARRACLAIGIGDAPPLTYLGGAVRAAEALGAWAKKAGYVTKVLTDKSRAVRLKDIETALAKLLPDREETDRLIISFAGHGVLNGLEDLWLLSQWLDENEAISISAMRHFLARYNLRQLVIVSDACRKASTSAETGLLTPHPGVRRGTCADRRLQTDLFRATSSYAAAFMLRGSSQADDRCLFSTLLVEALNGGAEEAFMQRDGRHCLFSDSLATWLDTAVPARAKQYGLELEPEIEPGLRFPDDLYVDALPEKKPRLAPWPDPAEIASISLDSRLSSGRLKPPPGGSWSTRHEPVPPLTLTALDLQSRKRLRAPPAKAAATPVRRPPVKAAAKPGQRPPMKAAARPGLRPPIKFSAKPPVPAGVRPSRQPGRSLTFAGILPAQSTPTPTGVRLKTVISRDREAAALQRAAAEGVAAAVRDGIAAQSRPAVAQIRAGFGLYGAQARAVWLGPGARAVNVKDGRWWRIESLRRTAAGRAKAQALEEAHPLLVELDDGRWAGAAAMPAFVATFGIDGAGVSSLVCRHRASKDTQGTEQAIAYRAAGTLSAAQLLALIIDLRAGKHQDPVLGVLAAYLHDRAGDLDNVIRTACYFVQFGQPIPFDIALLARLPARRRPDGLIEVAVPAVGAARAPREGKTVLPDYLRAATPAVTGLVAGAFPWLREGWSLLDPDDDSGLYPPELAALAKALTPALFTTLSAEGGRALVGMLERWGAEGGSP
ncbi:caspase family protein [Pelomonas sp. APW6]|uniref:Caspase family protein n=1 Tax=Roseateles subflavus TaxID=3053353 RepID=A0ABT7LCG4_9BURK|nr:caspase family protein [Pelomonas sp. APW6]MDL5030558.1 caspase family protein [Pelomonas sp. APW6]